MVRHEIDKSVPPRRVGAVENNPTNDEVGATVWSPRASGCSPLLLSVRAGLATMTNDMDLSTAVLDLKPNPNIAEFGPGDTVRVHAKVVEGDRERIQVFEGVVIRRRNAGSSSNFTVRRVTHDVGVERTFPIYSPRLDKVEVVRRGKVRRAKLYYLRGRTGRAARIKEAARQR